MIVNAQNITPNVILILLDDLGWSDFGCFGSEIPTPNIDALAYSGIRCTNFYNAAKCSPSRAMLLTGIYAHQNGFGDNTSNGFFNNATTLGEVLKEANYNTAVVGKHHASENLFHRGFDKAYGLLDGAMNYFNPGLKRIGENEPAQKKDRIWYDNDLVFNCRDSLYQNYFPPEFYSTVNFTNKAINYLQEFENNANPFFLYLSFNAPHFPLQAPDSLINQFEGYYEAGHHQIRNERCEKQKQLGLINASSYPLSNTIDIPDWNNYSNAQRSIEIEKMKTYAAMVKMVDIQIGKLVAYLENTNQRDNTLILISSDNGASAELENNGNGTIGSLDKYISTGLAWAVVSNTPFRRWKRTNFEGGINSPLIANWPKGIVNTGRIVRNKLHFIDLMPTLINICNARYKFTANNQYVTAMQGKDFSSIFKDEELQERNRPLFFKWENHEAVIFNNKKAIYNPGPQVWDFYDLEIDATETNNIKNENHSLVDTYVNDFINWHSSVSQLSPVALNDTLDATYNKISLLKIFKNDFDDDNLIDFSKTRISKQPKSGILNFINDTALYYLHFKENYLSDTFEYVIYDKSGAFSQACQVIVNICSIEDSCALLLETPSSNLEDKHFHLFPNPVSNEFVLFIYNQAALSIEEISIYNYLGMQVDNFQIDKLEENKFKINMNNFNPGNYIIKTPYKSLKILKIEN